MPVLSAYFRNLPRSAWFGVTVAVIATVAFQLHGYAPVARPAPSQPVAIVDPLDQELHRCEMLDMAAIDDAGCKAAWAENRKRFLTYTPFSADPNVPAAAPTEHRTNK